MKTYLGKTVQLIYHDSNREVTIRNVKIVAAGEGWIKAYCYSAQNIRTFSLDRIVDIELIRGVNKIANNPTHGLSPASSRFVETESMALQI